MDTSNILGKKEPILKLSIFCKDFSQILKCSYKQSYSIKKRRWKKCKSNTKIRGKNLKNLNLLHDEVFTFDTLS